MQQDSSKTLVRKKYHVISVSQNFSLSEALTSIIPKVLLVGISTESLELMSSLVEQTPSTRSYKYNKISND
jgi:hypothetical protein